jgi:hypothetical protein
LRIWSIYDVDRPGAGIAWEPANLPPPAWSAVNKENGHAHLVWGLRAPVLVDSQDMRQAPLRYLLAVESRFREALQADPGYSGLITKNPVHPVWRTLRGPVQAYDLAELAEWIDLKKHIPHRGKVEEIGLGRNVTLFDQLRKIAYRELKNYKGGGENNYVIWQSHLNQKALLRNGDFARPLDGREVWAISKSVAKWTWRNYEGGSSNELALAQRERNARRKHHGGGRSNAEARIKKCT